MCYAHYDLDCDTCTLSWDNATTERNLTCFGCNYHEDADYGSDPIYTELAQPLSWFCAVVMPLAYVVGLVFTLKTHSYMYERRYFEKHFRGTPAKTPSTTTSSQHASVELMNRSQPSAAEVEKDEEDEEGCDEGAPEEKPQWGKLVSTLVLLCSVAVYTGVADVITEAVTPMLQSVRMSEEFMGLTLIAITPNLSEYLNAVIFALRGDLDLSLEISGQGAVQVALLQVPVLVLVSSLMGRGAGAGFTLIFPTMHIIVVVIAIVVRNEMVWDSRANYFMGAAMLAVWLLLVAAFWFVPGVEKASSIVSSSSSAASLATAGGIASKSTTTTARGVLSSLLARPPRI